MVAGSRPDKEPQANHSVGQSDDLRARHSSPLHTAIRAQFTGRIAPENASPAIFLLTHRAFEPSALRTAASIYSCSEVRGAACLVQCLQEEARAREAERAAGRPDGRQHSDRSPSAIVHVQGASGRLGWYVAPVAGHNLVPTLTAAQIDLLAAFLTGLAERIGLCAGSARSHNDGAGGSATFNDGVRAAQKEVEALILRLPAGGVSA